MKSEWTMKRKQEVIKKLEASFLEVADYPKWLVNTGKDGKVRMSVVLSIGT